MASGAAINQLEEPAGDQAGSRSPERGRGPGARRSWVAYASAFLVVVLAALIFGLLSSPGVSAPGPGKVIGSTSPAWDQDRPSLVAEIYPVPQSASVAEWQQALRSLQQAVENDPSNATAQRQLAIAYYNLGRLKDARSIYEALLGQEESALVRNRLGNVLRDQGDLKGAEAAYRKAIEGNRELSDPYMNLSELLWRTHRDAEATAVLQEGLQNVSEESRVLLERALEFIQASGASQSPGSNSSVTTG